MHIPDGFLKLPVWLSSQGISIGFLWYAVRKLNRNFSPDRIPLMGISAAFVFTAQLLSFPVLGGTSVHISGALLIAILLGPASGFTIMASTLILQALLIQHGGILTLGANILNIGVVQCLGGYLLYRMLSPLGRWPAIGTAVIFTKILAAVFCAFELAWSGTVPLKSSLLLMSGANAIGGVIEAMVTVTMVGLIARVRPDIMEIKKI
jgi:cobalt/nickel transport system permease protein